MKQLAQRNCIIEKESAVYESTAWGFNKPANSFLNKILQIKTYLNPNELLVIILDIETKLGRNRIPATIDKAKVLYSDRTIDIDIIFYQNLIVNSKELIIPHPLIKERRFILEPLNEIAPDFIHPLLNLSINQLLMQCKDQGKVTKVDF